MEFDWNEVFINDLDWSFTLQIVVRTLVMFSVILIFLRMSGKKGVRQLSIFEVAIIIGLGSAAGDPMSNKDSAILPALLVFLTVLGLYRLITWIAAKSEGFESVLEGDPVYIIEDGMFNLDTGERTYAKDEFFSEMRQQNIEHLGQVRTAILETNGNVSFFYYDEENVKPGLPVLPKLYQKKSRTIEDTGEYACTYCGNVQTIEGNTVDCNRCQKKEWVRAIQTLRLT
jgi:uncharacterized membrane protein YcaP (DUF421 family)